MKTRAKSLLPTVLAVVFFCSLFAGCDKNTTPATAKSEKMSRLIAVENAQLIKKLKDQEASCQKQLANQKILNDRQIKRLKYALDKSEKENQGLHELSDKGVQEYMSNIVGPLVDENNKLKAEIKNLEGQIALLKAQVGQLKENP